MNPRLHVNNPSTWVIKLKREMLVIATMLCKR